MNSAHIIKYLTGYKSIPRKKYVFKYLWWRAPVLTPFREKRKYNKNTCKNEKKSQEQKDKEEYRKFKFKKKDKNQKRRRKNWSSKTYTRSDRRGNKINLHKIP